MLERYKTFHPNQKNIEELKNVLQVKKSMGPTASTLSRQGHSELHKKSSSLFESCGWAL